MITLRQLAKFLLDGGVGKEDDEGIGRNFEENEENYDDIR